MTHSGSEETGAASPSALEKVSGVKCGTRESAIIKVPFSWKRCCSLAGRQTNKQISGAECKGKLPLEGEGKVYLAVVQQVATAR